jgi:hypothetical protein
MNRRHLADYASPAIATNCSSRRSLATQPGAQARLARQQYSSGGHDKDSDERNRPHRLLPARPNWDHDRQNDSAEDEPVDDAVQSEPVTHGPMLRQARASSRSLSTHDVQGVFANAGPHPTGPPRRRVTTRFSAEVVPPRMFFSGSRRAFFNREGVGTASRRDLVFEVNGKQRKARGETSELPRSRSGKRREIHKVGYPLEYPDSPWHPVTA